MAENFDSVRAPQFVDFTQGFFDDNADEFFDKDAENETSTQLFEEFYSPFTTPAKDDDHFKYENDETLKLRRSVSVGNLNVELNKEVTSLCKEMEVIDLTTPDLKSEEKNDNSCRVKSSTALARTLSKDNLNKLAQPKYASTDNLHSNKYISFAESVNSFQKKTPKRFRSKPKLNSIENLQSLHPTVPHSPALLTKLRSRPQQILTFEEREQLEFKNQQKFKIKAHPVNQKVLQGPVKPTIPVQKQFTKPEPFALTEVKTKKVASPSPKKPLFHAKPAPRITPKKDNQENNAKKTTTIPQTPTFMKQYQIKQREQIKKEMEIKKIKDQAPPAQKLQKTCIKPFSFDYRDQQRVKKRENQIKQVLETEKKAREFHAHPVPKFIKKHGSNETMSSVGSKGSSKQNKSQEEISVNFKARPPTVLYKEPFVPVKAPKPLVEINNFQLYTELRAEERERFEQQKKEKEKALQMLKEEEENLRLQKEAEEIARLRKEALHKAQPIRKYKELVIQPSNKVTLPVSPKFLSGKRNKENEYKNNSA